MLDFLLLKVIPLHSQYNYTCIKLFWSMFHHLYCRGIRPASSIWYIVRHGMMNQLSRWAIRLSKTEIKQGKGDKDVSYNQTWRDGKLMKQRQENWNVFSRVMLSIILNKSHLLFLILDGIHISLSQKDKCSSVSQMWGAAHWVTLTGEIKILLQALILRNTP